MIRQLQTVQWQPIPGYNGLYLLSELGNIYNTKTRKYLTHKKPKKLAAYVGLCLNGNSVQLSINKLIQEIYGNIRAKTH